MPTRVRSYSKVNLGLAIGPSRPDGFHSLVTLYQTLGLCDFVTVEAHRLDSGETRISLTTNHPQVPVDERNTAWKMVAMCMARLGIAAEVTIYIEKNLPVQGGMGAGSANAAAALIGLEKELGTALKEQERLELAADVGSDVPLFLIGGAVLGSGRGEIVEPMPDLPATPCVIAVPEVGVSTPAAFLEWDRRYAEQNAGESRKLAPGLTLDLPANRLEVLSLAYASVSGRQKPGTSGIVPNHRNPEIQGTLDKENDLAENTLLSLVRTGAESVLSNDFEEVVFPEYPSLRSTKRLLMGIETGTPALYAALSGSGSALFGLYRSIADAEAAQQRVQQSGIKAFLTETLPRAGYWARMFA